MGKLTPPAGPGTPPGDAGWSVTPAATPETVRALVTRALALRYHACMAGWWPEGLAETVSLDQPRVAVLRAAPRMNVMFATDRLSRFWLRDRRWFTLSGAMLRPGTRGRPVDIADLVAASGLSRATVKAALARGCATGDLVKQRGPQGRMVLLASPALAAHVEGLMVSFFAMAAAFCGRRAPDMARLLAEHRTPVWALGTAMAGAIGRNAPEVEAAAARNFLFTLWDLLLEPGAVGPGFVLRQADRMGVSAPTVRAVLDRAQAEGFLAPGPALAPSDLARQRLCRMLSVAEARWNLLLDALEAVERDPALAAALDPGPGVA